MWPDQVSNQGPMTYESGALPIALRSLACFQAKLTKIIPTYHQLLPLIYSSARETTVVSGRWISSFNGRLLFYRRQEVLLHCPLKVYPTPFNPVALRKAKIVYNFGLSECYRVELQFQQEQNRDTT